MDFRRLGDLDLAGFATNVMTQLGGSSMAAIDSHVSSALATSFGSLPATLETEAAAAAVAREASRAAVAQKNQTRRELIALLRRVRDTLTANNAPKDQYAIAGFDYADLVPTAYSAQDPTDLSAFGYSNGVITLRFTGNNKPSRVVYEIWRRHGDTVGWGIHALTRRQRYVDTPVTPGQYYEYKVRAVAAKSVSNFSNSAVVYGAP
jgi:hypothetical protein